MLFKVSRGLMLLRALPLSLLQEACFVTCALENSYGRRNPPSRFLDDIPTHCVQVPFAMRLLCCSFTPWCTTDERTVVDLGSPIVF